MTQAVQVTIKLDGDVASLKTAMAEAERAVRSALGAAGNAAAKATGELDGVDEAGRKAAGGTQAFVQALRDQIAVMGKSEADVLRYKAAQAGVAAEAAPLILQLQNMRAALAAKAAEDAEGAARAREQAAAVRQQAQAQQQFIAALRQQVETQGMDPTALLRYRAAQLGVTQQADALIAKLHQQGQAAGVSAAQTAAAMRMLPAQLTDVVTQLAGGANPFLVLLQQGGQVKDSFGGIGPMLSGLRAAISPTTLAIGGLAGAGLGLAAAFIAGSAEGDRLTRTLLVSGNAAQVSGSSIEAMGARIQAASGVTAAAARQAITAVVGMGNVGPQAIEPMAQAIAGFARLTGRAVDEVAADFARLREDATGAALEINKRTNFLTAATFLRIKALQEQGRAEQAAAEAARAIAAETDQRNVKLTANLSAIGRAAKGAGDFLSNMWEAAKGIGQAETADERIARLRERVESLRGGGTRVGVGELALFGRFMLPQAERELADAVGANNRTQLNASEAAATQAQQRGQIAALGLFQPQVQLTALPRTAEQVKRETQLTIDGIKRATEDAKRGAGENATLLAQLDRQAKEAIATTQREGAEALFSLANAASERGRAAAGATIDAQVGAARRTADALIRAADARELALQAARDRGIVSEREAVQQSADIEADRIAAKRAAVQQELALEARRPLPAGDGAASIAQQARLADLRAQVKALDDEAQQVTARATADVSRQVYAEAEARFEAASKLLDQAQAQVRQMAQANMRSAIGLIADPVRRATAEAEADIADLQRSADDLTDALRRALTLARIQDPDNRTGQATALQAQIDAVTTQTNAAIATRTRQLAQDLKPAWQTMVEGWRDTTRLMRENWDETFGDMVASAEGALVGLFRTGKFNGGQIVEDLLGGMARGLARRTLAGINVEGIGGAMRNATGMAGPEAASSAWNSFMESLKRGTLLQDAWNLITKTTQVTEQSATMTATASMTGLASAATAAAASLSMLASSGGGGGGGLGGFLGSIFGGSGGGSAGGDLLGTAGGSFADGVGGGWGGFPMFAAGGTHAGGWRVVGENGPELEATGPARIFNADDTRRILAAEGGRGAGGGAGLSVNVQVQNNAPGVQVRQEQATGPDGQQMVKLIVEQATAAAKGQIAREVSEGRGIASVFEGRYGLRPSNMARMG